MGRQHAEKPVSALGVVVMALFFITTLANVGSTTLECGFGPCPDNPDSYLWLPSSAAP